MRNSTLPDITIDYWPAAVDFDAPISLVPTEKAAFISDEAEIREGL